MILLEQAGCMTAAVTTKKKRTALMLTAMSDNPAAVQMALDKQWSELEARDADGYTAFLLSCHHGKCFSIPSLIDAGCSWHVVTNRGDKFPELVARRGPDSETLIICHFAQARYEARRLAACDKPIDKEHLRRIKKALTAFRGHNLGLKDAERRLVLTLADGATTAATELESWQLMADGRPDEAVELLTGCMGRPRLAR